MIPITHQVPSGGTVPEPMVIVFYCFTEAGVQNIYFFNHKQITHALSITHRHVISNYNMKLLVSFVMFSVEMFLFYTG